MNGPAAAADGWASAAHMRALGWIEDQPRGAGPLVTRGLLIDRYLVTDDGYRESRVRQFAPWWCEPLEDQAPRRTGDLRRTTEGVIRRAVAVR